MKKSPGQKVQIVAIASAIGLASLLPPANAANDRFPDQGQQIIESKAASSQAAAQPLQALEPIVDSASTESTIGAPTRASEDLNPNNPLQGGVLLEESAAADKTRAMQSSSRITFSSAQPTIDLSSLVQKLLFAGTRSQWTPEQFRKLEYGVLGIVATKTVFSRHYTVTQVLPGCPAALAGIQTGDVEIAANGHVFTAEDDQRTYWHTVAGKAGTPVDIVISRKGEPITFHLTRMNIEDIENEKVRRMFERMLSLLGPPTNP